jgi:hypothetical protein
LAESTLILSLKLPPQDLLHFDECAACRFQVASPCALPCGHSCCKSCIEADATVCPVSECLSPLMGFSKDSLSENWIAFQFSDTKSPDGIQLCNICAEDGIKKAATYWCASCSQLGDCDYFCKECFGAQHSTRITKNHVKHTVQRAETMITSCRCEKHNNAPKDLYCMDSHTTLCYRCRDEGCIQKNHKTKLVTEYGDEIRSELKSRVSMIRKSFENRENYLKNSKNEKQHELKQLEERIELLKKDLVLIEKELSEGAQNQQTAKTTESVLMKTVQEFPLKYLLDQQRLQIMKSRIETIVKQVAKSDSQLSVSSSSLKHSSGPIHGPKVTPDNLNPITHIIRQEASPSELSSSPPQYLEDRRGGNNRTRGTNQRGGGRSSQQPRNQDNRGPPRGGGGTRSPNVEVDEAYIAKMREQRLLLGERLYPLVAQINQPLAGKIIGMFLNSGWSVEYLSNLLTDETKVAKRVCNKIPPPILISASNHQDWFTKVLFFFPNNLLLFVNFAVNFGFPKLIFVF